MPGEAPVWQALRNHVFDQPKDRAERIENVAGSGNPDVNYCIEGCEGWIELKAPVEPVRRTSKLFGQNHKLTQSQKNWMLEQHRSGGRCFIFVGTNRQWILLPSYPLAERLNDLSVLQVQKEALWIAQKGCVRWSDASLAIRTHLKS